MAEPREWQLKRYTLTPLPILGDGNQHLLEATIPLPSLFNP